MRDRELKKNNNKNIQEVTLFAIWRIYLYNGAEQKYLVNILLWKPMAEVKCFLTIHSDHSSLQSSCPLCRKGTRSIIFIKIIPSFMKKYENNSLRTSIEHLTVTDFKPNLRYLPDYRAPQFITSMNSLFLNLQHVINKTCQTITCIK